MKSKVKRLFFDIETSPNVGYFWSCGYKQRIDYENLIEERAIICICYKWEGGRTQYLTWDKNRNDKEMLRQFIKIANEADELCGHNSDKFDLSFIRTRCLFHRLQMFPNYISIDTLKISRSKFRFNSNKLDYISSFLGFGGKIKTDYSLWKRVMKNEKRALNEMVVYCKRDVEVLEKVYLAMKNHIPPKTSITREKENCPECGSNDCIISKTRVTAQGYKRMQLQCKDCGKYHTIPIPIVK